ncbi:MAG: hypothetical protein HRU19_30610 [Pseudobacteriovorax sp.]|nr:hypothetical protein [Pseudobacteriovorax sp.]
MAKLLQIASIVFAICVFGSILDVYINLDRANIDHIGTAVGMGKWFLLPLVVFLSIKNKIKSLGLYVVAAFFLINGGFVFIGLVMENLHVFRFSKILVFVLGFALSATYIYFLRTRDKEPAVAVS